MKKIVLLYICLSNFYIFYAQKIEWALGLSASNNSLSENIEIKVSKNGDIFNLGSFHDSLNFNLKNNGIKSVYAPKLRNVKTVFLSKYDNNLNLKWVKFFNGNQRLTQNIRSSISNMDKNGNITLGITFSDSIEIEEIDTIIKSKGLTDFVLLQFNNLGNLNWIKHFEGKGVNEIHKQIIVDSSDNIILTGVYSDSFFFNEIDNNRDKIFYDAKQNEFLFIAKLDHFGNTIWFKPIKCSNYCRMRNVHLDSKQDIVSIGFYNDSIIFDNNNILTKNRNSSFDVNSFILKYSKEGVLNWTNWIESKKVEDNYLYGLCIDNEDNIYTSGYFSGEIELRNKQLSYEKLNNKNYNLLLTKYKSNGTYLWSKTMINGRRNSFNTELAVDKNRVYLAGEFADSLLAIDTENKTWTLKSNNIRTTFLSFLNFEGRVISLFPLNDLNQDYINNSSSLVDIALQDNAIYLSGNFAGQVDFDPTKSKKVIVSNNAMFNAYISKYSLNLIDRDSFDQKPPISSIHNFSVQHFSIYPNPFTDKIQIENPKSEKFSVQLTDLQGKTIAKSQTISSKSYTLELDKNLPKGLYFLEIKTESETSFHKILKVE